MKDKSNVKIVVGTSSGVLESREENTYDILKKGFPPQKHHPRRHEFVLENPHPREIVDLPLMPTLLKLEAELTLP